MCDVSRAGLFRDNFALPVGATIPVRKYQAGAVFHATKGSSDSDVGLHPYRDSDLRRGWAGDGLLEGVKHEADEVDANCTKHAGSYEIFLPRVHADGASS